eukprot:TRINITY_DN8061_c0_g2_i3.p1 TRINITY_DN8061_c0_g2~~TRINITY_DN8061_c0_g2_i3.p1  ORF type:complete len:293 (+),score=60.53 TRINITY_DN8061_c0_g2_i3:116-994(+)
MKGALSLEEWVLAEEDEEEDRLIGESVLNEKETPFFVHGGEYDNDLYSDELNGRKLNSSSKRKKRISSKDKPIGNSNQKTEKGSTYRRLQFTSERKKKLFEEDIRSFTMEKLSSEYIIEPPIDETESKGVMLSFLKNSKPKTKERAEIEVPKLVDIKENIENVQTKSKQSETKENKSDFSANQLLMEKPSELASKQTNSPITFGSGLFFKPAAPPEVKAAPTKALSQTPTPSPIAASAPAPAQVIPTTQPQNDEKPVSVSNLPPPVEKPTQLGTTTAKPNQFSSFMSKLYKK